MGHLLNAFILKGPFDESRATAFDMRYVALPFDLTMFFVTDEYIDEWADRLDVHGGFPKPVCNFRVIHHMMKAIAREPLFAVIETEYTGGLGRQCAAVYRGDDVLLDAMESAYPDETKRDDASGPIDVALRHLGVTRKPGIDEFDTVGLGAFRSTSRSFGKAY